MYNENVKKTWAGEALKEKPEQSQRFTQQQYLHIKVMLVKR